MFEKVLVPYIFNEDEKAIIDSYYHTYSDWNNPKLKDIKDNLKQFLRYQQDNECCYCRQPLGFDNRLVDIEHIVDKKDHDTFGFESKNLALSCPACNSCKTQQETLVDPSVTNYPIDSNSFQIIHPYYDNYSEHIERNYPIFISKSAKGDKTIEYCKLDRLVNIENRQKETMLKTPLIKALIKCSSMFGDEQELFNAIIDIIGWQEWPKDSQEDE